MGKTEKKNEERKSIQKLKNKLIDFPQGEIIEDEKPDFLIKTKNKTVGIEVTRIFKNTNEDDITSLADDYAMIEIVEKAKQICETNSIIPLEVSIQFYNHKNFHRINKIPIIIALANLVALNVPNQNGLIEITNDFKNSNLIPEVIHSITIANFNLNVHHWDAPTFGWVQETFDKELQKTIFRKNEKLKNYLRKCDECWLLIDAPGIHLLHFLIQMQKL